MKKISKITLENFRAFAGKNVIDFNNSENTPADLICIYGKNGSGKTSMFDGFEWFFTGKISLFEDDLKKNAANYKGHILKNKYAEENARFGIDIEYSDGTKGYRTGTKRGNSINDYKKGKTDGYCEHMLTDTRISQILPHNKIDSFVYASKPSVVYEEWGDLWDPNRVQRKTFETVYTVYKKCMDEFKEYNKELRDIIASLNEINIEKKIRSYNESVKKYNEISVKNIPDLNLIEYTKGRYIAINDKMGERTTGEQLNKYLMEQQQLAEQCEFLKQYLKEYQEWKEKQKSIFDRNIRRQNIIEKCQYKKVVLNEINNLEERKIKIIEQKNDIQNALNEQWFDRYKYHVEFQNRYRFLNEALQNDRVELQKIRGNIEIQEEKIQRLKNRKKIIDQKCEEWKIKLENIGKFEETLLTETILKYLDEIQEEDNKQLKYTYRIIRVLMKIKDGDSIETEELTGLEDKNTQNLINELKKNEETLKHVRDEGKRAERAEKDEYEKMKENFSDIEQMLILAKNEVEKSKSAICPVCKTEFENKDKLLKKINPAICREAIALFELRNTLEKEKRKANEKEYEKRINDARSKIYDEITKLNRFCCCIEDEINICNEILHDNQSAKQKVKQKKEILQQDIIETFDIQLNNITEEIIEKKCNERKIVLDRMLFENTGILEREKNSQTKYEEILKTNKELIENYKKRIEEFNSDKDNQKKLQMMEKRGINSIHDLQRIVSKYSNEIQNILNETEKQKELLAEYGIYKTLHIEKYKLFIEIKTEYVDWVDKYEQYKNKLFTNRQLSEKNLKKYKEKIDKNINYVQQKQNIFNECISDIIIEKFVDKYNNILSQEKNIQRKLQFSQYKEKNANKILKDVQRQLEEYIKNRFGSAIINQIYSKIEPHKRFTRLQYKLGFDKNGNPEMYRIALNETDSDLMPELFFSSAQLNTVALSIFLGGALSISEPKLNTILIDDPIGHFDDINVLSFIDVLRTIINKTNWQIIISTHEENFYEIMKVKLSSEYYNSKFFVFESEGRIIQDK